MDLVLTTAAVSENDQLAYWCEAMAGTRVPMAVTPRGDGPFAGRITIGRVGYLRVATVEADAYRAGRTASHIARSAEQFVGIGVQVSGRTALAQGGRRADAGPGDLYVYDTAHPYILEHPERFSVRIVHMPRRALGLSDAELRRVTGTAIGTGQGCGAVLMPFLTTLVNSTDSYSPTAAGRLAASVIELFATLVAETAPDAGAEEETSRGHLVARIRDHIDRNLGDPALAPEGIAKAHHISVRYLHRLFEDEGITVGRLVQRRRLEECARELGRGGRAAPTVSSVAQRWGFVNPAHFSRVFRGAYGISPREWRSVRAAWNGDGSGPFVVPDRRSLRQLPRLP
ncbi:helix-turn-helix domain-containing protein [Streptomyces sp. HP-A2021]|uniref:AraC-like ligand-binding domain-containing protein n=1 Tax=Streptomyces sp. HP-A2021 TaxID=2927875 RepID=UPI001FAF97B4|nr:helix-turn-helix domain-containing protein [Streptomyces sp. HP-A2021]UOB15291.1 helix-turn-helix domain-containing protein [Streptomyces sp. HP-A2021]